MAYDYSLWARSALFKASSSGIKAQVFYDDPERLEAALHRLIKKIRIADTQLAASEDLQSV